MSAGYWLNDGTFEPACTPRICRDDPDFHEPEEWVLVGLLEAHRPRTVCINAFDDEGNYTDVEAETVGWSVYVRNEPDAGGQFDCIEDHDVTTEAKALDLADRLFAKHGAIEIRTY
jgi:hypothetical protein